MSEQSRVRTVKDRPTAEKTPLALHSGNIDRADAPERQGSMDAADAFLNLNVMRPIESMTDGRLNLLQRVLSEQMAGKIFTSGKPGPADGPEAGVTGARAKRLTRRRLEEDSWRTKEEANRLSLNKSIDRVETVIQKAKGLGMEVAPAARRMMQARAALNDRMHDECFTLVAQSQRHIEKVAAKDLGEVLEEIRSRMLRLRSVAPGYIVPRELVKAATGAVESKNWTEAVLAVDALRSSVRTSERGVVLNLVLASKPGLVLARRLGLDVSLALAALRQSREDLKRGDLEGAVKRARESREIVTTLLAGHREAERLMSDLKRLVAIAGTLELDISQYKKRLNENNWTRPSREELRTLVAVIQQEVHDRVEKTLRMAEKSLADSQEASADVSVPEDTLARARTALAENRFVECMVLAGSSMMQSSAALMERLDGRLKEIDHFSRGIDAEVENLTQVQEALEHSKEKSLEEFRRRMKLSEELVSKAYDSAISYTKVSQDIVKETHDNSVAMTPRPATDLGLEGPDLSIEDKRSRIAELQKAGRITESQRERLLSIVELSQDRADLI